MADSLSWLVVFMAAGLAAALGAIFCLLKRPAKAPKERRKRMCELAEKLGFRYYSMDGEVALHLLPPCGLFEKGGARSLANLIAERSTPPRALVFDYAFVHQSPLTGDRPSDYDWSVLYLVAMAWRPDGGRWASARIYRKDWLGGPVGVRGLYVLTFEGDPAFGTRFLIAGEPREQVSAMLTPGVRRAIGSWTGRGPHPVVEILADWVMAYVESEPTDREVVRKGAGLLNYACGIARALCSVGAST